MAGPRASVLIVGLGLIGGSVGMALSRRGWHVTYVDPAVPLALARDMGAAGERFDHIGRPVPGRLLVLATPLDVAIDLASQGLLDGWVATTTCSLMLPFVGRDAKSRVIAGHPFAGKESSSIHAADPDLFQGKTWFLDDRSTDPRVDELVVECGGVVHRIDPEEHDRIMALTSHLPQLVSTALGSVLHDQIDQLELFAGSGLRTVLRLAGSEGRIWEPVLAWNRSAVESAAEDLEKAIRRLLEGEESNDFARAREVWRVLLSKDDRR